VTEADLIRFVDAQAQVYRQVVEELSDGRKRTHWMWFIFPQLSGLGHSAMVSDMPSGIWMRLGAIWLIPFLGTVCAMTCASWCGIRTSRRWKFWDRPMISSFGPASPSFMKPLPMNPTVRYSRKLWSNSTMVRQILAHWNCCGPSNPEDL
jgi:Protein of unknown function (DUF1810)